MKKNKKLKLYLVKYFIGNGVKQKTALVFAHGKKSAIRGIRNETTDSLRDASAEKVKVSKDFVAICSKVLPNHKNY